MTRWIPGGYPMPGRRPVLQALLILAGSTPAFAQADPDRGSPLHLEARIPLGEISGRIDHLAVDIARRRLFVAELGNNSVSVVDLDARAVQHRIQGLREPQGVAYVPGADILLVANAGDGSVERFHGTDLKRLTALSLGADADNLRLDPAGGALVWVGHSGARLGSSGTGGGLTALEAASGRPVGQTIPLPAHPESFQLEAGGSRAWVNIPGAGGAVAMLDRASRRPIATWSAPGLGANFPMAVDEPDGRLFLAFRNPPTLAVLDLRDGALLGQQPLCGDADDLFFDARRRRLYAICGQGAVDVFDEREGHGRVPQQLARVPTAEGARTGLFVPEFDRLFVAMRARTGEPAALWVLRPEPPPSSP
jgi:YVTN family beta-propeller protein